MRTLIAGGAGFIGSNLARRLLDLGDDVLCLDNLVTGRHANLAGLESHPRFRFVQHDVVAPLPVLPSCDRIFHLASPASPPGYQRFQVETLRANSLGTERLLEFALACGARLLYASTSEAYGDPLEHPQRESYRGNVSSIGPRSMYDEGKRFGEALVMAYVRTRGADARIVRIFNTYGPASDPADGRLVPNFISQALRGEPLTVYAPGTQTRSLCYVSDLVEGLLRAIDCHEARGSVVNLGNPEEHTVLEFAEEIIRLTGSSSTIRLGPSAVGDDPQRRCPDIERAIALLGWRPVVGLRAGLAETVAYFRRELGIVPTATALAW